MNRQEALQDWRDLANFGSYITGAELNRQNLVYLYRQWCYKKLFGAFNFKGFPNEWDYDYFITTLFMDGLIGITDTEIGVIPLACGIAGVNVFSRPTTAVFANPVLPTFERELYGNNPKTSCALVKIQYDYKGVRSLVDKYAYMLAECDTSIYVNLRNCKVSFIGMVSNKQTATTMQKMYHELDAGKPAVYLKKDGDITTDTIYYNHVKETYIAEDLQILKNKIKDDFLTEIGLNNTNIDKRERLVVDEVNANNDEIKANVQHWIDNIEEGFKRANNLFNLNLSVELRKFDGEGRRNEEAENIK